MYRCDHNINQLEVLCGDGKVWKYLLLHSLIFGYAFSQTIITTIPDTENGYAYVFDKGDLNTTVYCEVIVHNILCATSWYLQRQSDEGPPMLVFFDPDRIPHTPSDLYDNIIVLGVEIIPGGQIFRTNFTILNFIASE